MAADQPTEATLFAEWCRQIWRAIRDEYEVLHGKGSFRLYKSYQPELLRRLYPNVVMAERIHGIPEAAAVLLSYGIVLHPFENANHRTFITITRIYLQENGYRLASGGKGTPWYRSAASFIRRSKRIRLTLSEVAYPDPDMFEGVADVHETMTTRWVDSLLKGQSGRSTTTGRVSIRRLITRGDRPG